MSSADINITISGAVNFYLNTQQDAHCLDSIIGFRVMCLRFHSSASRVLPEQRWSMN